MNKFIKFTIGAIVALLIFGVAQGLEVRAATPEALRLAALVARQEEATPTSSTVDESDATPEPKTTEALSKLPPLPAVPTGAVDTAITTKSPPSASGSAYAPSGTGSLIPSWSALIGKGVPTGQPSAPPTPESTAKAEAPSSAHKLEVGLISGGIIAGIVSFFF